MDIVTVGLKVKDDGTIQVKAFGDVSEKAAKQLDQLEQGVNRIAGSHAKAASASEGHRLATGKVSRALEGLIVSATGANAHLGAVSIALSDMALGGAVVTGVLAGVAAISFVYEKLTHAAREAKKEQDDLIASFEKAQRLKAQGGTEGATVNALDDRIADAQKRIAKLTGIKPNTTIDPTVEGSFIVQAVTKKITDAQKKDLDKANAELKAALAERDALFQKNAQDTDNTYAQNLASLIAYNSKDKELRQQGIKIMEAWEHTLSLLPKTDTAGRAQLAGNITALHDALFPKTDATQAARDAKEYADNIARAQKASVDLALSQAKSTNEIEQQNTQALRLRDAALAGADAFQKAQDEIAAENQLAQAGVTIFDARYEALRREIIATRELTRESGMVNQARQDLAAKEVEDAKKSAAEEEKITENLIRSLQETWGNFFQNILETGLASFTSLFGEVKRLFQKLIADLLAAKIMKKITDAMTADASGSPYSGMLSGLGRQIAIQGAQGAVAGGVVGFDVGHATGSAGVGALTGAASGAAAGAAVAGPVGALTGGIAGLVGGLLGGAAAARQAADAMRQLKKDFEAGMAAFKHNDLAQALAEIAAEAEKLRQTLSQLNGFDSFLQQFFGITTGNLGSQQAAIDAQEARNKALAEKQARDQEQYNLEDLQVRNLRALGRNDEADRLAFQEQQQREFTAAQDKAMADGVITLAEQLYLNTLKTTENNELIAFNNGLLADAVRNAPSGFFVNSYLGDFADRTKVPDPFGTGTIPPNWPVNTEPPGTGSAGGSGLNPPGSRFPNQGGGGISAPTQATFDFSGTTININGNRSGEEMLADFKAALKKRQAATVGPYGTLSDALDRL